MAKTPKIKRKAVSVRSRAARRGEPSSTQIDKSLEKLADETKSEAVPKILGVHDGGITKRRKGGKQMTRRQRLRHEKGLELADRNQDKLQKKLATSRAQSKKIKERAATWEDIDGATKLHISNNPFDMGQQKEESSEKVAKEDGDVAADLPSADAETLGETKVAIDTDVQDDIDEVL